MRLPFFYAVERPEILKEFAANKVAVTEGELTKPSLHGLLS